MVDCEVFDFFQGFSDAPCVPVERREGSLEVMGVEGAVLEVWVVWASEVVFLGLNGDLKDALVLLQ